MRDEPTTDFDAWCFEIAAAAVALDALGSLPKSARRQLDIIRDRAMRLHRFAADAEAAYLDHVDSIDPEDDE